MAPKFTVKFDQPLWLLKLIREKRAAGGHGCGCGAARDRRQCSAGRAQEHRLARDQGSGMRSGSAGTAVSDQGRNRRRCSRRCRPRPSSFTSTASPACSSTARRSRASRCCGYRPRTARRPASKSGKKLVSATVRGKPMLFDANDKDRHRKPLYIGVPSVRIPKKFRIFEIVKKHVKQFKTIFAKHFKAEK